jgi:hypothetical protein
LDYWLSKLMYDLQDAELRQRFREDPESVIAGYPLTPAVRRAALDVDIPFLRPLVNAYLLRFYCGYRGMGDAEFIAAIRNCTT